MAGAAFQCRTRLTFRPSMTVTRLTAGFSLIDEMTINMYNISSFSKRLKLAYCHDKRREREMFHRQPRGLETSHGFRQRAHSLRSGTAQHGREISHMVGVCLHAMWGEGQPLLSDPTELGIDGSNLF